PGIARCWTAVRLLCAMATCALAPPDLAFGGTTHDRLSCAAQPARAPSTMVSQGTRFRLGTAAAPFGAASAIADPNPDGLADFVVVDRIASSGAPHRYAIEVAVSNSAEQRFVLASSYDAVTVGVEDIDDDDDLDIVVTPALTRDVLAAWLNDGAGRFTQVM